MEPRTVDAHSVMPKKQVVHIMSMVPGKLNPNAVVEAEIDHLKAKLKEIHPYITAFLVDCDKEFDENDEIHITVRGILPDDVKLNEKVDIERK